MRRKVSMTIFMAMLLAILFATVAVYQVDAGIELVDGDDGRRTRISGSASNVTDAPTGNILKKYKYEAITSPPAIPVLACLFLHADTRRVRIETLAVFA